MQMRFFLLACLAWMLPFSASAHQLNVFASVDCKGVLVESKFSNGKNPVQGELRVFNGERKLLTTFALQKDGTVRVPLDQVDHSGGLIVEIHTGSGHDDYWIVTPEDIASGCKGEGS